MSKCKDCKHWESNPPMIQGKCTSPKIVFAVLSYLRDAEDEIDYTKPECYEEEATRYEKIHHVLGEDEAAVVDGSGYFAAFRPGPEFGCIHFEAKEGAIPNG